MKPNETISAAEARQREIEREARSLGVSRYRKQLEKNGLADTPVGALLIRKTGKSLADLIEDRVTEVSQEKAGRRANLIMAHIVKAGVDPLVAAELTYRVALNHIGRHPDTPLQSVAIDVADAILDDTADRELRKGDPYRYAVMQRALTRRGATARRHEQLNDIRRAPVPPTDKLHLGAAMLEQLAVLGLFETFRVGRAPHNRVIFRLTEAGRTWFKENHERAGIMRPVKLPMVSPPRPWSGLYGGGYLEPHGKHGWPLIRSMSPEHREGLQRADLSAVYAAVNHLQERAWRVNKPVLNVMKTLWEEGARLAGMPPREDFALPSTAGVDWDAPLEKAGWKRAAAIVHTRNNKLVSKRLAFQGRLWIAERFAEEERFFFPWQLDWRGRAYPMAERLNPQGEDADRALLAFADGKRIGKAGDWLAVHVANVFGFDKGSFAERIAWTERHTPQLLASARDPLDGGRDFWAEAEDPWQALAAAFEWAGYVEQGPEFITYLPLPQDGSSNALQHYAAILRDPKLAALSNLTDSSAPEDFYCEVTRAAQIQINISGDPKLTRWRGSGVTRKISKAATVRFVYNGTLFGIRDAIIDAMREAEDLTAPPMIDWSDPDDPSWAEAVALAKVLIGVIGEVAAGVPVMMRRLKETGADHAKQGRIITWWTPDGLPVTHEYWKQEGRRIKYHWLGQERKLTLQLDTEELDPLATGNGLAPNWIHSHDAAHLRAVMRDLRRFGLQAPAAAHDSFATLAPEVSTLKAALAAAFRRLHEGVTLYSFLADLGLLEGALAGGDWPEMGSFDLKRVAGRYMFG